jgi:hypothetical protein
METFLDAAAHHADGHRLPKFVEQELREFLRCGVLPHGFARLRCGDCAFERLVRFSCKGRGFCPSCGGRRMTESAARLLDGVLTDGRFSRHDADYGITGSRSPMARLSFTRRSIVASKNCVCWKCALIDSTVVGKKLEESKTGRRWLCRKSFIEVCSPGC